MNIEWFYRAKSERELKVEETLRKDAQTVQQALEERDQLRAEVSRLRDLHYERTKLTEKVIKERDALQAERDALLKERNSLLHVYEAVRNHPLETIGVITFNDYTLSDAIKAYEALKKDCRSF